jgi:hypothetical protein
MHPTPRRVFMLKLVSGTAAIAATGSLQAAPKKVEESEPKAASLGYKHDSSQVDTKKFPKHVAGQKCTGCMAWLGKPSDAWAECDLMADRLVNGAGWCSSFVKVKG